MGQHNNTALQGLYSKDYEHDACGVGFVVNYKGKPSHKILCSGMEMLHKLEHRGGQGAEPDSGDGAGVLLQIPHEFFVEQLQTDNITLPSAGNYGVGMFFMPWADDTRQHLQKLIGDIASQEGLPILNWRIVPTDPEVLGPTARQHMPCIMQCFFGRNSSLHQEEDFEKALFVLRKRIERSLGRQNHPERDFYAASLSATTIVYKGMLTPLQVDQFYLDLQSPKVKTSLALVHSRFSTNTFPSWERAHPNRYIAHNGEINTLRGNVNWMKAREGQLTQGPSGSSLGPQLPILDPDGSDSSMLDNCLEFLRFNGFSLPHALLMMIPEPWSKHDEMDEQVRNFYQYHSCLMEPWDGPAAIAFSDGRIIGGTLDRNGLRPSRYYITKDDLVVMASEVGVLDIPPEKIVYKGRLSPGKMLLIDTKKGQIIEDEELKQTLSSAYPYGTWLKDNLIDLIDLDLGPEPAREPMEDLTTAQLAFGYTYEEIQLIISQMAAKGVEPTGSMGIDIPLAVLSDKPQLLYNYFKQLFAQVTNPAIDAIREDIVIATDVYIGSKGNLLQPAPENCRQIHLQSPVLNRRQFQQLAHVQRDGFQTAEIPIVFHIEQETLSEAMMRVCRQADQAVASGANILILSDKSMSREYAAIPALLAVSGLHHHMTANQSRSKVELVLESGEPREVHHLALLLGYGVAAVYPYLAYQTLEDLIDKGFLPFTYCEAEANYSQALVKGVVKVMSKMGISTVQSYRGSQIFEAVGLSTGLVERFFPGTPTRIEGIDLDMVEQETRIRHNRGFLERDRTLDAGGRYKWRKNTEEHLFNPETVHLLQQAVRTNDYKLYTQYAKMLNDQDTVVRNLRGLLQFSGAGKAIPLERVESADSIVRRFKTGAMSFGSISKEAHESLAIAMNRIGGKSNSGEGGEDPSRFTPDPNGDLRSSAIKQVASGRFGVTSAYLNSAQELQIKIAQGAKPGEGGQLPGRKVYPWIAKVRHSTPGVGLISPPPHHDIYSIEDLAQLIYDLKNANKTARISVKLVAAAGVGTVAAGVAKGRADLILISGYDGGTGASPSSSIHHAGLPWELGLAETQQTLARNHLRNRVVLETDGKLMTGRDVAIAAILGAEEFGIATAALVSLGCIMMRVCHQDTCPVGVATQNPELRKNFRGRPEHVVNLFYFIAEELRQIMASLGVETCDQLVGQTQLLQQRDDVTNWKAKTVDLSKMLQPAVENQLRCTQQQDHQLDETLDSTVLIPFCDDTIPSGMPLTGSFPIQNTNRVVGTMLGSEITKKQGATGLPEGTIQLHFRGSAGQSFGAFIPKGLTLTLEGDANDYLGKGLSGGRIIVRPDAKHTFAAEDNIIIGNVAFYGATQGEAYIRGRAGERFCVRNSGVKTVVEGIGDHGCEYMTGGLVIILGPVGRNFAAGMSGGTAYLYDPDGKADRCCNKELVAIEPLARQDQDIVQRMLEKHRLLTDSVYADRVLQHWSNTCRHFIKIMPQEYKKMLDKLTGTKELSLEDFLLIQSRAT